MNAVHSSRGMGLLQPKAFGHSVVVAPRVVCVVTSLKLQQACALVPQNELYSTGLWLCAWLLYTAYPIQRLFVTSHSSQVGIFYVFYESTSTIGRLWIGGPTASTFTWCLFGSSLTWNAEVSSTTISPATDLIFYIPLKKEKKRKRKQLYSQF